MQIALEILLDFSSSMTEKLDLTKKAILDDIIPKLDFTSKIGIKTFSTKNAHEPFINPVLPLSITNKEQIIETIFSLPNPSGNTPIAAALKESVNSLKEYTAFEKKIILITDGEENCGGDYILEIENAKKSGINCQIHIIGIGLTKDAETKAKSISNLTNGSFSSIPYSSGSKYNANIVKSSLAGFYDKINQYIPNNYNPSVSNSPITTTEILPKEVLLQEELSIELDKNDQRINLAITSEKKIDEIKYIIDEIREIKEQLKILSPNKDYVPDVIEDSVLNEKIRDKSESYLYDFLKRKYYERVNWLNENGESYQDHDFEILDLDNSVEYFIECKGTSQNGQQFYMTKEEWRLFLNHTKNYQIYFIQNSLSKPNHIFIDNLLDWILKGKIVPYLIQPAIIKDGRVVFTILTI